MSRRITAPSMMRRSIVVVALLSSATSGCVSNSSGGPSDLASTASPSRYAADPDKPRQVCESTAIGGQPKTVCY